MANNPLRKYFRQPKVYVSLPSKGVYNNPGTFAADPENMPIYGMTGMDELLLKTPDALLNGESTVKVIESCCSAIKDAWDLSILDLDLLLVAIRIATYGNVMNVTHTCPACKETNDYDIELGNIIEHYKNAHYENKIVLKDLAIKIRPLNYKQWTAFQLKSFAMQRQLAQAMTLEDEEAKTRIVNELFEQLTYTQKDMMIEQIDTVEVPEGSVDQQEYITEWVTNSEQSVFEAIKKQIEINRLAWEIPAVSATCPECNAENKIAITMDQSSFFVRA